MITIRTTIHACMHAHVHIHTDTWAKFGFFLFACRIYMSEKNIKNDNFGEMKILKMPDNRGFLFDVTIEKSVTLFSDGEEVLNHSWW